MNILHYLKNYRYCLVATFCSLAPALQASQTQNVTSSSSSNSSSINSSSLLGSDQPQAFTTTFAQATLSTTNSVSNSCQSSTSLESPVASTQEADQTMQSTLLPQVHDKKRRREREELPEESSTSSAQTTQATLSSSSKNSEHASKRSKLEQATTQTQSLQNSSTSSSSSLTSQSSQASAFEKKYAAESAEQLFFMGCCFNTRNKGIPANVTEEERLTSRFRFWQLAARKGHARAQYQLALCYEKNQGAPTNFTQEQRLSLTFRLNTLAAQQGMVEAQYNLALCYLYGKGVPKSILKALAYFAKAADNNMREAQAIMYKVLSKGIYLKRNEKRAAEYFEKMKKALGSEEAARKFCNEQQIENRFFGSGIVIDPAEEQCVMCTEKFQVGAPVEILRCWHCFCPNCVSQWFSRQGSRGHAFTCPICRAEIINYQLARGTIGSLAENESSAVTEQQVAQQSASSSSSSSQKAESKESKA